MNAQRPFRRILHLRQLDRDVEEEISFHFEQVIRELERHGLTRAQAEAEARRRFGDERRYRSELMSIDREFMTRLRWIDRFGVLRDALKYAWRSMAHAPALSFGIVVAFALGIGANATVFNLVDRLLLRAPPGLRDPASLRAYTVQFYAEAQGRQYYQAVRAFPDLTDLRGARTLAGSAGYNFSTRDLTIGRGEQALRVKGLMVTGNYFSLLGVSSAAGRLLVPSDDRAGAERVVVLSHGFWQRQYGGSADAIGRTIDFGQGSHTIVGVLPKGFTGVDLTPVDLWLPVVPFRSAIDKAGWEDSRSNQWLKIVVRLSPGVSDAAAQAELTTKFRAVYLKNNLDNPAFGSFAKVTYPEDVHVTLASVIPGKSPLAPSELSVARWLALMSVVVLVIACLNISNLLLARAIRERRALGIRLALGVTRARLIGQVVLEVVLFALMGGAAAMLLARYGGAAMQRVFLPNYAWDVFGFPLQVAWVTILFALVAGIVAAALPALQMASSDVLTTLRATAGSIAGGRARLRTTLVIVQVALSVVLLAGAGVFVRSFRNAANADLGINPRRAWYMTLVTDDDFAEPNRAFTDLALALATVPGVQAAGASSTLPFYNRHGGPFRVEGWDSVPDRVYRHVVQGNYFAALDLSVLNGRLLGDQDVAGSEPAAVVNQEFARKLFPKGPIGRCLYIGENATRCTRIVGVVENALLSGIRSAPALQFYINAAQHPEVAELEVLDIRLAPGANAVRVLADARRTVLQRQPKVRYVEVESVVDELEYEMRSWRLGAVLFSAFGVLALILASLGLYAVISFDVSQQMREIGLRAALGASSARLLGAVVKRAALLAGAGLLSGLALAWAIAPRFRELIYHVSPRDPWSLGAVVLVLLAVAVLTAVLPGLRAARVDPVLLIRAE